MGGKRLLSLLGLPPSVVRTLEESSFIYDEDVRGLTPSELMEAVGTTLDDSCEVLRLSENEPQQCISLLDMIESAPSVSTITTLSSEFDTILGGGVSVAAVTEIAGTPGIGKTQLCLQLSVNVQFPERMGGLEGEAVIIDTEGSVNPIRIKEIAEYAVTHYQSLCEKNEDGKQFNIESILSRIHYYRCLKQLSVVACIKQLPELLLKHPTIKFVAIDSLAFHLRHDVPDYRVRAGLLATVTQDLIQLATKHNLAVLVTNQMTTRVTGSESAGQNELVPALGESWAHCPTLRVVCRWIDGIRTAKLIKAPHMANNSAKYQVTAAGIRDVTTPSANQKEDALRSAKRKRDD